MILNYKYQKLNDKNNLDRAAAVSAFCAFYKCMYTITKTKTKRNNYRHEKRENIFKEFTGIAIC